MFWLPTGQKPAFTVPLFHSLPEPEIHFPGLEVEVSSAHCKKCRRKMERKHILAWMLVATLYLILLSCILMHKSCRNMDAMPYSTVGPKGGFSVVNSPVSSAFSPWSQFVSQSRCRPAVCRRFMSQGASGQRGDHIMGMMALLSWVPSQKTRQAGAG